MDGNWNPEFWTTTNMTPDTTVFEYTPPYAGNAAMRVRTLPVSGGFVMPGMAYTNFVFHQRPSLITICLETIVTPTD